MRIEKKNLPNSNIRTKSKWILATVYFSLVVVISYIFASRARKIQIGEGIVEEDYEGDFYQIKPKLGELSPITWREDGSSVAPNGTCSWTLH